MLAKRIVPCLDVKDGRVVKGVNFEGLKDMADPVEMAHFYNDSGADELVFYDITASAEGRQLFTDVLRRVASEIFIPLTVGGGIRTLDDFDRVLKCGADKVSVNSGAIADPSLIAAAAKKYGDQCVVLSMDVKRVEGQFRLFAKGGREDTGIDAMDWPTAPGRSSSTPSIPTGSRAALTWRCWTPWRRWWMCPSWPPAAPGRRRTLPNSSATRGWTPALPPPSSTPARWTSRTSSAISVPRAWRCVCKKESQRERAKYVAFLLPSIQGGEAKWN